MGETEKKVLNLAGNVAKNILVIGLLAVASGAMLMTSKDLSKDTMNQATQIKNIIKTAIADAIEEKKNK